ncbi:hypothetical protein [Streptomyces sp. NPDC054765]
MEPAAEDGQPLTADLPRPTPAGSPCLRGERGGGEAGGGPQKFRDFFAAAGRPDLAEDPRVAGPAVPNG